MPLLSSYLIAECIEEYHGASLQALLDSEGKSDGDDTGSTDPSLMAVLKKRAAMLHRCAYFENVERPGQESKECIENIRRDARRQLEECLSKCPAVAPLLGMFKPVYMSTFVARRRNTPRFEPPTPTLMRAPTRHSPLPPKDRLS